MRRDLALEREFTYEAARGHANPDALILHAETRAAQDHGYGDPWHVREDVDWLHEARAELADCRNYLCWWLAENVGHELAPRRQEALQAICAAYQRLEEDG